MRWRWHVGLLSQEIKIKTHIFLVSFLRATPNYIPLYIGVQLREVTKIIHIYLRLDLWWPVRDPLQIRSIKK